MERPSRPWAAKPSKFETVTGDAERHLELIMANAASRATQLTAAFAREAERLKEASEAATQVLASLSATHQGCRRWRQDPDRRKRRPGQA